RSCRRWCPRARSRPPTPASSSPARSRSRPVPRSAARWWAGAAGQWAFALQAASSAGAVILLAGVREPPRAAPVSSSPLADIREGTRFLFRHPLLRPVFVTQFIFNTALFVLQAVFVPYAVRRLGLSATGVGMTLASYGIGMVAGALVAARVMRHLALGI